MLTAKYRDQLRKPALGIEYGLPFLLSNCCKTYRGGAAGAGLGAAGAGALAGVPGRLGVAGAGGAGRAWTAAGGDSAVAVLLLLGHAAPRRRQLAHRLRKVLLRAVDQSAISEHHKRLKQRKH